MYVHTYFVTFHFFCSRNNLLPFAELSVKSLVRAERESRQIHPIQMEHPYEMRSMQPASITDIGKSMREQLMILVEWAKKMPWFLQNLDLDDQVN